MDRLIARMEGSNEGMSSACEIESRGHDKGKMAVLAAAACGMEYSSCWRTWREWLVGVREIAVRAGWGKVSADGVGVLILERKGGRKSIPEAV